MALAIVLISLPRQLDGYFAQQDQANLEARTEAMATLVGNQIIQVDHPRREPVPGAPGARHCEPATRSTGRSSRPGFVQNLTPNVALADVTREHRASRATPRRPSTRSRCRS